MNNDGIYTFDEYKKHAQEKKAEMLSLVEMHDDDETFEIVGASWWAKYSSVDTPEKMLACIYHLSKNTKLTTQ